MIFDTATLFNVEGEDFAPRTRRIAEFYRERHVHLHTLSEAEQAGCESMSDNLRALLRDVVEKVMKTNDKQSKEEDSKTNAR